jgi:carbamate kinase
MLIVVALGGNALLRRGEPLDAAALRRNVRIAAETLAELSRDHTLVVTHGNGPQVGLLALQSEAYEGVAPYPLDVLGAESDGMVGYLLEQGLRAALPSKEVATLLTQVEVSPSDPAFGHPDKRIGPIYSAIEAESMRVSRGWSLAPDAAGGVRRVVASPEPTRIVELNTIRRLVEAEVLLICAGGGGIPVAKSPDGTLGGVEAVIDKDLTSALLAECLDAEALLLLTDQPAVYADWPQTRRPIRRATVAQLRARSFAAGSMGPKVEAACRFVESTGAQAAIGALCDGTAILNGTAGTTVLRYEIK